MSSFGAQRSQTRVQTRIFAMTVGEAQANSNTMTGTMVVLVHLYEFSLILGQVDI